MKGKIICFGIFIFTMHWNCVSKPESLPILGEKKIQGTDTIFHKIPNFQFIDQDSQLIDNNTFSGKAYIVDFFFISCPTICPKVKKQMLRIYTRFDDEPLLNFLSHSIDTKNDSVANLKIYANNLGVKSSRWHFVTGEKAKIYEIADDYFSIVNDDPDEPGGFDHSGRLILIDPKGHIRSFCDGTNSESVDNFIKDIECLLQEIKENNIVPY